MQYYFIFKDNLNGKPLPALPDNWVQSNANSDHPLKWSAVVGGADHGGHPVMVAG